jgi:serine protease Do
LFRLLPILAIVFLFSCASKVKEKARLPLVEHELYLKMKKATLVLLVNNKENGSAAFISSDGFIASASHCIRYRDDKIEVISDVLGRLPVRLVALDKAHDFMLLKADLKGKSADFLTPAKENVKTPEKLYQMGAPIFRRGVLQCGTVARDDTYFEYYGERHNHYLEIIHVSASVQGGTSGGPWVNRFGDFVGIQSGTLLVGDSPSGLAFMAPVNSFRKVIQTRKSARSYNFDFSVLPLEAQNPSTIKRYKGFSSGLVVSEIKSSSIAKDSGLSKWDLIIAVGDTPVRTTKDLITEIRKLKVKEVQLTIVELDQDKSKKLDVPVEIVEDRIKFQHPPKEVADQKKL